MAKSKRPEGKCWAVVNWDQSLIRSVILVHESLDHPGAEHWASNTEGMAEVWEAVRMRWAHETNYHRRDFPYNVNATTGVWTGYRKLTKEEAPAVRAWAFEFHTPPMF